MDGGLADFSIYSPISTGSGFGASSPTADFDFASFLVADMESHPLPPAPNQDSIESPAGEGGFGLPSDGPTCGQVANKETEVQSPDLDPEHPDYPKVQLLRKITKAGNWPTENGELLKHPSTIASPSGTVFVSNNFDLLEKDTLGLPDGSGSWRGYPGGMGWAIKSLDGRRFFCIKKTFQFQHESKKTNWILSVYIKLKYITNFKHFKSSPNQCEIDTSKNLCHVFQSNNYDPTPLHRSPIATGGTAVDPEYVASLQTSVDRAVQEKIWTRNALDLCRNEYRDPNAAGPTIVFKTNGKWSTNAAGPSEWMAIESCNQNVGGPSVSNAAGPNGNCNPHATGPSAGIAIGKKKRKSSSVWDNFTVVSASSGPEGKVLEFCICNNCGNVYKKASGTSTLGKHKCNH